MPSSRGSSQLRILSDYYIDRKMGHDARRTPIVLDGEGPVFIPGGTVADRVKIGQNTERVIHIIFTKGEESHEELGH